MSQLLAEVWAVPAVYHRWSAGCSGRDPRMSLLIYTSTLDHVEILLASHFPRCTPSPLMKTKREELVSGNCRKSLPPLLKEDPVFREAEVHEGFWNSFNHRRGSAQVTQSSLWVHVFPQRLLCDSPIWWHTREVNQLIKKWCCGTYCFSHIYVETLPVMKQINQQGQAVVECDRQSIISSKQRKGNVLYLRLTNGRRCGSTSVHCCVTWKSQENVAGNCWHTSVIELWEHR